MQALMTSIPKIFHQIWVGSPLPDELRSYMNTWVDLHPTWEHVLWTDAEQAPMHGVEIRPVEVRVNKGLYDAAEEYAPYNIGQLKADVLRYELLFFHGGVYVDADFECFKPIDSILQQVRSFAAWESQDKWLSNAIMGSAVGNPFIRKLIAGLQLNANRYKGSRPNRMTGPRYLTRMYFRHSNDMTVFDKRLFYPYLWNELHLRDTRRFPNAFAAHHWWNARVVNPSGSRQREVKIRPAERRPYYQGHR
jgi:inositol phosphorylceramide mannosyltransferase catalytic subunit